MNSRRDAQGRNALVRRLGDETSQWLANKRVTQLYTLAAIVLVPWIVYLAATLPKRNMALHYRASWVGFDIGLVGCLGATAWLARKHDPRVVLPAGASSALLFTDAWFDITTAGTRRDIIIAFVFAIVLEIPTAIVSLLLARSALSVLTEAAAAGRSAAPAPAAGGAGAPPSANAPAPPANTHPAGDPPPDDRLT